MPGVLKIASERQQNKANRQKMMPRTLKSMMLRYGYSNYSAAPIAWGGF